MKIGIIGYGSMGKMLLWKFSESGLYDKGVLTTTGCQFDLLDTNFSQKTTSRFLTSIKNGYRINYRD